MDRIELLANIREFLCNVGFSISNPYITRVPVFDLVARQDDTLLIIKVLSNVDGLSEDIGNELRALAYLLKATPLLIGEKNGMNTLEDDVVYFRFGIQTVTLPTLKNYLIEKTPIRTYAAPGGLYMNLDPEKIRMLRQEKNISLGTFARHIRVSRRTVRMYEDGMSARVDIANRIEDMFEQTVTTPIDLLKPKMVEFDWLSSYQKEHKHMNEFQREILSFLQDIGYNIIPMGRCPFEALSKEKEKILLTCVQEYNKKLIEKAYFISSISKIMNRHAVMFTNKEITKKNIKGTPVVLKTELKKIRDPEDLFSLILERISAE